MAISEMLLVHMELMDCDFVSNVNDCDFLFQFPAFLFLSCFFGLD